MTTVLADLFHRSGLLGDDDLLRVSRQIGKFRKTLGLSLGLTNADIENCKFKEEDPYAVCIYVCTFLCIPFTLARTFLHQTTPFAAQIRRVLTHFGTSESLVVNLQS